MAEPVKFDSAPRIGPRLARLAALPLPDATPRLRPGAGVMTPVEDPPAPSSEQLQSDMSPAPPEPSDLAPQSARDGTAPAPEKAAAETTNEKENVPDHPAPQATPAARHEPPRVSTKKPVSEPEIRLTPMPEPVTQRIILERLLPVVNTPHEGKAETHRPKESAEPRTGDETAPASPDEKPLESRQTPIAVQQTAPSEPHVDTRRNAAPTVAEPLPPVVAVRTEAGPEKPTQTALPGPLEPVSSPVTSSERRAELPIPPRPAPPVTAAPDPQPAARPAALADPDPGGRVSLPEPARPQISVEIGEVNITLRAPASKPDRPALSVPRRAPRGHSIPLRGFGGD